MKRDFTLEVYRGLCEVLLDSGYKPTTVRGYLSKNTDNKIVILRHDVDRNVDNALKMANLESKLGICSTYYFRTTAEVFQPSIIKQISACGHEIGYHYEVLDRARGDTNKAIELFRSDLAKFREIVEINTVCMHGNPLTSWINKDIWRYYELNDFGLIGEPYLSIDYDNVAYFSDTGRTWKNNYSIKDLVTTQNRINENILNTTHLIHYVDDGRVDQLCILTHPNRWNDNIPGWISELLLQSVKNYGKRLIKIIKRM